MNSSNFVPEFITSEKSKVESGYFSFNIAGR